MIAWLQYQLNNLQVYSLCQASGLGLGALLAIYNAPRLGISRSRAIEGALWIILSSYLGSRILNYFLYPELYPTLKSWLDFRRGGQVFYGGLIGGIFMVLFYTWYYQESLRDAVDLGAPSLGLGHMIGRLGCLSGGCCYGIATNLPWGMDFDLRGETALRHPTQLYEAGFLFFLFIWALRALWRRDRRENGTIEYQKKNEDPPVPGRIFGIYVLAYSCFRFMVEFIRDDDRGGFFTLLQLSPSQLIAIGTAVIAIAWLDYCRRRALREHSTTTPD